MKLLKLIIQLSCNLILLQKFSFYNAHNTYNAHNAMIDTKLKNKLIEAKRNFIKDMDLQLDPQNVKFLELLNNWNKLFLDFHPSKGRDEKKFQELIIAFENLKKHLKVNITEAKCKYFDSII